MNQTADDLDRAADLLDYEYGWCQHALLELDEAGELRNVCMEQAISMACSNVHGAELACYRAVQHYWLHANTNREAFRPLWCFNDDPGRTKQEVVDSLRNAAKHLREQR